MMLWICAWVEVDQHHLSDLGDVDISRSSAFINLSFFKVMF